MKHLLLLTTMVVLAGCSTTSKKNGPAELSLSPHKEIVAETNVALIPFESPIAQVPLEQEEVLTCSQDESLFLLSAPHEVISSIKNYYESIIRSNIHAQEYSTKYFSKLKGLISQEEFITYQQMALAHLQGEMELLTQETKMFALAGEYQKRIHELYPTCSNQLEKMLTSKRFDPKQNGCENNQYKTIVFDPYEMKQSIIEGISIEQKIRVNLYVVNDLIASQIAGNMTEDQLIDAVNQVYAKMKEEQLPEQSEEAGKKIRAALQSSYDVKDNCLKAKKKK